jgi:hypothetical protein
MKILPASTERGTTHYRRGAESTVANGGEEDN